jgi:hypothetical protein
MKWEPCRILAQSRFFIAPIESPWDGNLIRGRISEKSRQNDCRGVRFICPFSDSEFAETKASDQGYFALKNVRPGKYIAFTLGKRGICEMAEVTILFELGKTVRDLSIPWTEPAQGDTAKKSHLGR